MAELPAAARRVPKATYQRLSIDDSQAPSSRAILKFGYVRQLQLQPGDVAATRAAMAATKSAPTDKKLWTKLTQFEGMPLQSQVPATDVFAKTQTAELLAFGTALAKVRQNALDQLTSTTPAPPPPPPPTKSRRKASTAKAVSSTAASSTPVSPSSDAAVNALALLNGTLVANNAFQQNTNASPIGMLHLETIEMVPAGIDRGELIATIPLAPLEQTSVVQKEWSVTSQEFTSIVTDSLENYSETGVTENNELAQSTTSQSQHSNQFNVNATVSGSFPLVTSAQVSSGFQSQDQNSQTKQASAKHALATTKKASSRVKQSHKVTISTTTVTGTSETTTRTLQNPSNTNPMRIDYYSLMRKWHVGLYQYGLRFTYDIVIPEPGGSLREAYRELASLQAQAARIFTSPVQYSQIEPNNIAALQKLGDAYGAAIPTPPSPKTQYPPSQTASTSGDPSHNTDVVSLSVNFEVTDGQQVDLIELNYNIGENHGKWTIDILGYPTQITDPGATYQYEEWNVSNVPLTGFMQGATGQVTITCVFQYANPAIVSFNVHTSPTADAIEAWRASVYSNLYNAAQTAFYTQQQALQNQIQALQDRINNVDTLTLRREEHDEIMKGVLQWLLGPGFDFMPDSVAKLFHGKPSPPVVPGQPPQIPDIDWGIAFPSNKLGLSNAQWMLVSNYEQAVRFINDAIDWDNIIYFLYSYFWDVPVAWENIRDIKHPDSTRQAFLRAGAARVVLTVRKGWEYDWVNFVEFGVGSTGLQLQGPPPQHPYLTIAQEIRDYDSTNYPGIPPANPGGTSPPDDGYYASTLCRNVKKNTDGTVTLGVDSTEGFQVGYTVTLGIWGTYTANSDPTLPGSNSGQETQTITAVESDPKKPPTITISGMTNGYTAPFPVLQGAEKGVLIAEWFEHTPSSGTDIAVTTNVATSTLDTPSEVESISQ